MVRRAKTAEASWAAETWRPYANIGATTIDWALRSNFCYPRYPGRVLAENETPPAALLDVVAAQLQVQPFNRLYGTVTRKGTFFGIILVPQREKKIDKTGPDPLEPVPSIPCA